MTFNDLDWLERSFYVKFSLLRTDFETAIGWLRQLYLLIIYLFTVESVYTRVTSGVCGDMGSGTADRDPQNIWNPRKNCGSFVDTISSES